MDLMPMNPGSQGAGALPVTDRSPAVFCRCLALVFCAAIALAAAGCHSLPPLYYSANDDWFNPKAATPAPPPPVNPGAENYSTNELHEGDVVGITFQYSTNFDTVQKIALDGRLNLDMVGAVKASGLTVIGLQEELATLYKSLAEGDVITVKLLTSEASVSVSGAVLRPGPVVMDRPLTVLEAVMAAGGWDTSRAKLSAVTVLRVENGRQQTYQVNLKNVLAGKEKSPFYLKPFDIIYVPAKTFNY